MSAEGRSQEQTEPSNSPLATRLLNVWYVLALPLLLRVLWGDQRGPRVEGAPLWSTLVTSGEMWREERWERAREPTATTSFVSQGHVHDLRHPDGCDLGRVMCTTLPNNRTYWKPLECSKQDGQIPWAVLVIKAMQYRPCNDTKLCFTYTDGNIP